MPRWWYEIPTNNPRNIYDLGAGGDGVLFMMTREELSEAVLLAIAINRGWFLGIVRREKEKDLESLKSYMDPEQLKEYNERIK